MSGDSSSGRASPAAWPSRSARSCRPQAGPSLQVSITASNATSQGHDGATGGAGPGRGGQQPPGRSAPAAGQGTDIRPDGRVGDLRLPPGGPRTSATRSPAAAGRHRGQDNRVGRAFEAVASRQEPVSEITPGGVLQAMTILPREVTLAVARGPAAAQGILSGGQKAPRADLPGAVWALGRSASCGRRRSSAARCSGRRPG